MSDDRIKRDIQYIRALESERNEKATAVKELESKIAFLRKNPANKIANDLYIYQYNKEIDVLKSKIAQIEKQISSAKSTFGEEMGEDEPVDEDYSLDAVEKKTSIKEAKEECRVTEKSEERILNSNKSGVKSFFSAFTVGKSIFLAVLCVISSILVYQLDKTNFISIVGKYNRLVNLSFICLLAATTFLTTAYFALKGISKKPLGGLSDYYCVYAFYLSLNLLVGFAFERTKFKLVLFLAVLVYSISYFLLRVRLYGVDLDERANGKSALYRYYYDLFKRYNLLVLAFLFVILAVGGYVFGFTWVTRKMWEIKHIRVMLVIDCVIIVLAFLYYLGFAFFRMGERDLKIIDLAALIIQLFAIGICCFAILVHRAPYVAILIFAIVSTLCSVIITVCRVIGYTK